MILVCCVDDRGGTMFNGRRQSQDRLLRADLLAMTAGKKLWMNDYSRKQFTDAPENSLTVDEDFLAKAECGDYCFAEGVDIAPWLSRVERLVLYRWNRVYPFDRQLDLPPWRLTETVDFPGSSHKTITKETYAP